MKRKSKARSSSRPTSTQRSANSNSGIRNLGSWAETDPTRQAEKADAIKEQMERKFAPETWVADKPKFFWFVYPHPIFTTEVYSVTYNGRFTKFVKPVEGRDLFAEEGHRSATRWFYEVIDVDGYVEKKTGKPVRNIRRIFPTNFRQNQSIQAIDEETLQDYCIKAIKSGSGQQTTYSFIPDMKVNTVRPDFNKIKGWTDDEIAEIYEPPSEALQKQILANCAPPRYGG